MPVIGEAGRSSSGSPSGILNSAARLGTAVGIAALGVTASLRTHAIDSGRAPSHDAVTEGIRLAFIVASLFAAVMLPVIRRGWAPSEPLAR